MTVTGSPTVASAKQSASNTAALNLWPGTAIEAWARDSAILASIAIQYGTPLDTVRHALSRDEANNAASPLGALLDILAESEAGEASP